MPQRGFVAMIRWTTLLADKYSIVRVLFIHEIQKLNISILHKTSQSTERTGSTCTCPDGIERGRVVHRPWYYTMLTVESARFPPELSAPPSPPVCRLAGRQLAMEAISRAAGRLDGKGGRLWGMGCECQPPFRPLHFPYAAFCTTISRYTHRSWRRRSEAARCLTAQSGLRGVAATPPPRPCAPVARRRRQRRRQRRRWRQTQLRG